MAILTVASGGLLSSILTLLFGIMVLAFPSLLRFMIGFYLIVVGALGLLIYFL
jgi:hypothetical protein